MQSDPFAIQHNSDVLHTRTDAAAAPAAPGTGNLPHSLCDLLLVLQSPTFKNNIVILIFAMFKTIYFFLIEHTSARKCCD